MPHPQEGCRAETWVLSWVGGVCRTADTSLSVAVTLVAVCEGAPCHRGWPVGMDGAGFPGERVKVGQVEELTA